MILPVVVCNLMLNYKDWVDAKLNNVSLGLEMLTQPPFLKEVEEKIKSLLHHIIQT